MFAPHFSGLFTLPAIFVLYHDFNLVRLEGVLVARCTLTVCFFGILNLQVRLSFVVRHRLNPEIFPTPY